MYIFSGWYGKFALAECCSLRRRYIFDISTSVISPDNVGRSSDLGEHSNNNNNDDNDNNNNINNNNNNNNNNTFSFSSFSCIDTSTQRSHPTSVLQTRCWWHQNQSWGSKILIPQSRDYRAAHPVSLGRTYRELSPQHNHRFSCNRCWARQTQSSFRSSLWWLTSNSSNCFPGTQTNRWRSQDFCCTETWDQSLFTSQLCLRKTCRRQRSSRPFVQMKHSEISTSRHVKRHHLFQRISIIIQKGNHLAYQSTFQTEPNF